MVGTASEASSQTEHLQIGQLADRAGLMVETIRYYERVGLLPGARRSTSGYRLYQPEHVRQLIFGAAGDISVMAESPLASDEFLGSLRPPVHGTICATSRRLPGIQHGSRLPAKHIGVRSNGVAASRPAEARPSLIGHSMQMSRRTRLAGPYAVTRLNRAEK